MFLDVDGTLLPSDGAKFDATLVDWQEWQSRRNPRLVRMDRTHGRRLLALACDLVWATAWMHDANEVIARRAGRRCPTGHRHTRWPRRALEQRR